MATLSDEPYGTYAPGSNSRFLLALVDLGLARGPLGKKIRKRWLEAHGAVVDAEVRGIRFRFDLSNNVTDNKVLLSSKEYDKVELDALAETCQGETFVDVGANMGYYTLAMLHRGAARAIAVEPNPPSLQRLRYNLALNDRDSQVRVIAEGVGPEGELELFQPTGLGSASFVDMGIGVSSIKVRTRPLQAILESEELAAVGALKIDVEGFEDQVLGPFLTEAPEALLPKTVVMEECHDGHWQVDLPAAFRARGYEVLATTRANVVYRKK